MYYLGCFKTFEEAVVARKQAEERIHKEFNGEINRRDFNKVMGESKKYKKGDKSDE